MEADKTATHRRSTKVIRKPKVQVAPPVSQLGALPKTTARAAHRFTSLAAAVGHARNSLAAHRAACAKCAPAGAR